MTILITGINGFVGSNFTEKWKGSHILYGLDINKRAKEVVQQIYGWNELSDIPNVDAIVHLAGKAHDTKNKSEADSYFEINTGLTKKIFDYFLESDATTFVFFSSVKAAADTVDGDSLDENIIPKPVGPYGESKIKAEEYILAKSQEQRTKTKRVYILRPAMIHGPGNKGNLNLLYKIVQKGIPWPLGSFENKRSLCSIDNISYVVEQLIIRENIQSGIYHICDDEPQSTNVLLKLMYYSLHKKDRVIYLPKFLITNMAKIGDKLHLPLNSFRLKKLTENYVVSNEKIKNALGIKKMPVSAIDGLYKTFESFKRS